jgi:hypothetical protein
MVLANKLPGLSTMASARSTAWMTAAGASAPSGSIPTPPNRDPGLGHGGLAARDRPVGVVEDAREALQSRPAGRCLSVLEDLGEPTPLRERDQAPANVPGGATPSS